MRDKLARLTLSMESWRELIVRDKVDLLLDSSAMSLGGTISDFVLAMGSTTKSMKPRGSIDFLADDWM